MKMAKNCVKLRKENMPSVSLKRQWINWILVLAVIKSPIIANYWIFLPSMHQFTTNPIYSLRNFHNSTDIKGMKLWPGLGASEYIYSWVVTAYSIGELVGGPVGGLIATFLPYYLTFIVALLTNIAGGLLYALATNSIMVFVARFVMGLCMGAGCVLASSYVGETAEIFAKPKTDKLEEQHLCGKWKIKWWKGKATLKDVLFILLEFFWLIAVAISLAISSVVTKFSDVEPFRWPGWFISISSALCLVVFLVTFKQPRPCCFKRSEKEDLVTIDSAMKDCSDSSQNKFKPKWKSTIIPISVYSFLVMTGYAIGALYAVFDTLMNPLLSDQFGFTVHDTAYFILALTLVPLPMAILSIALLKLIRIDNRMVLAVFLCTAIAGGFIMSDWQALSEDPCANFCSYNDSETLNHSIADIKLNDSYFIDSESCESTVELMKLGLLKNGSIAITEHLCEAASTGNDKCFWNPRSRITGKYCADCYPSCSSERKSLHFAQICVGASLIIFSVSSIQLIINLLASDYTPISYQGIILGAMFASGGIARIVSPIWSDLVYEQTGKHTYVVMTVKSGTLVFFLVVLLVLYQHITPKHMRTTNMYNGYTAVSNHDKETEPLSDDNDTS